MNTEFSVPLVVLSLLLGSGFVCDRSQCEKKGAIRIGSGQNFQRKRPKILGTATGHNVQQTSQNA
ncbi:MAG: hypothetical protein LIO62_06790 [Clostridiales bacterium]|nr:hypothetical protein [Clostridiales bacterium]